MPRRDDAPRDLLFGLLALQNGLVTRDQLAAAVAAWTGAPGRALADLLVEQGALDPAGRDLLLALADRHLRAHGGDPERSLAALDLSRSTRESLAAAGGPEVEAKIAHVGSESGPNGESDRTATFAVGTATADGQRTYDTCTDPEVGPGSSPGLGNYELLDEIGRGGMGVVFRARQKDLDRVVAVKMLLTGHLANRDQIRRFQAEARAAGRLRHPHVVHVLEAGQERGQHYFAMDHMAGPSLKGVLLSGPLSPETAARHLLVIARAVAYLHAHGVVHRDLKPSNILLNEFGQPCVSDFGLALLDLPSAVQSQVEQGALPPATAYEIARVDDPGAQAELAARVVDEGLSRDRRGRPPGVRADRQGEGQGAS
jgi:tRNA A-37 threonylcarbamoyl transferase component Bud32